MSVYTSEDGYLLQKSIPLTSVTRAIDYKKFNISIEMVRNNISLKKNSKINIDDKNQLDFHYVMDMCSPYDMPDDRDTFAYYNDIRALSGSAGYIRIRDGYVYDRRVLFRS